MSISKDDKQYIWHPFTQMKTAENPIPIVKGKGTLLIDENGKTYIDAISSWWVNLHGHANPYIAQKVNEQMSDLEHVMFAGFTHQAATNLCSKLSTYLPQNQKKFFFSGDGSSAVEIALKMSIQYWKNKGLKRYRILALEGGYHGETFGAMSAGAKSIFSAPFENYLFKVEHLPFPSDEEATLSALKEQLKSGEVACFIFEPLVQGASGMQMYSATTLDKMIALCKEYEVLCIADEVMTGFGRTGTYFACNQLTESPDLMCLSKSLSGGTLPLSLTTCSQDIYDSFLGDDLSTAFLHGHSFTGNPIGCAAAIASLELLEKEKCQKKIQHIATKHHEFAHKISQHSKVKNVRQCGTILAMDIVSDKKGYSSNVKQLLYQYFIDKGVLLRPLGNVLYILPPYCISDQELNTVYNSIFEALEKVE
jgi:adenosylmethionine-8-amino-7-oxononanoate aminotransferase